MGGNYEKGMCNQLMEVMDRFHIPAEYRSDVTCKCKAPGSITLQRRGHVQ